MSDDFWEVVDGQVAELHSARTADEVLAILSQERNPYGPNSSSADGFFAGDGGDMAWALLEAGWFTMWARADFHWAKRAPNGDVITYVEGDVYRGNRR